MDINKLEYFVSITRSGSLVGASRQLRLSSAALSKAIANLEAELGQEVFVRKGRGLILSEFGQEFLPKAEAVLAAARALFERNPTAQGEQNIRLATFEVFSTYAISKIMQDLLVDHSLELQECLPGEIERRVASGQADLGISYVPIPSPDVEHLKIAQVSMGVFGSLKFAKKYDGANWSEVPFVIPLAPPSGTPSRAIGLDGWPEQKVRRLIRHRVALMQSAIVLAQEGHVACFIPNFVAELVNASASSNAHLVRFKSRVQDVDVQDVFIIKRSAAPETRIIRIVAKGLRQLVKL